MYFMVIGLLVQSLPQRVRDSAAIEPTMNFVVILYIITMALLVILKSS